MQTTPQDFTDFAVRMIGGCFEAGWITEDGVSPYQWRENWPPFAVACSTALRQLNEEHYQWFRQRQAFPRIMLNEEYERINDGSTFMQDTLYIFQLLPLPVAGPLFHATPTNLVSAIRESGGLRPGKLSGVSTTGFRDGEHWIHVCVTLDSQESWIKKEKLLAERSQQNEWTILRIRDGGTGGQMFADPSSQTGFVLPDKLVPWSVLDEVKTVMHP